MLPGPAGRPAGREDQSRVTVFERLDVEPSGAVCTTEAL